MRLLSDRKRSGLTGFVLDVNKWFGTLSAYLVRDVNTWFAYVAYLILIDGVGLKIRRFSSFQEHSRFAYSVLHVD